MLKSDAFLATVETARTWEAIEFALRKWAGCPSVVVSPPSKGLGGIVGKYAAILEETPGVLLAGFMFVFLSALYVVAFWCFSGKCKKFRAYEITRLESEMVKLRDTNSQFSNLKNTLSRTKKELEEEVEKRKHNEAKFMELVKRLEQSEKIFKEDVSRRKQNEARLVKTVEEAETKLKEEVKKMKLKEEAEQETKMFEDLVKDGWKALPHMRTQRGRLGVAIGDGKLFAVGGSVRYGFGRLGSGEYLDLKDMEGGWKELPDMQTQRGRLGVAVADGKLFALGGSARFGYSLKSGQCLNLKDMAGGWKELPDMLTKRSGLGVAVGDAKLFCGWWVG
eukprot:jgi/Bigna1/133858/aug1.22_g8566